MGIRKSWKKLKKRWNKTERMKSFRRALDRLIKKGHFDIVISAITAVKHRPAKKEILLRLLSADITFEDLYQIPDEVGEIILQDKELKEKFLAKIKSFNLTLEGFLCWIKFKRVAVQEITNLFLDGFNSENAKTCPEKNYAGRILIEILIQNYGEETTKKAWAFLEKLNPSYIDLAEILKTRELPEARKLYREKEKEEKQKARILKRLESIILKIEPK